MLPSNAGGTRPFNAEVNSFAACTTASSGDMVGLSMCLCLKNTVSEIRSAPMCYSIPQNTYSDVEMSGGTIRPLSGHPKFSSYLVFCVFSLHNPSVPMASY